jgi:crossover junction endodeoxyribonuclease RuvC
VYILGIDPGIQGGAYAVYDLGRRQLKSVHSLPLRESVVRNRYSKKKLTLDLEALHFQWAALKMKVVCAVVEKVHSMPGQGVSSTFRFGQAYGQMEGILVSLGIKVVDVEPAVWKSLLCLKPMDKDDSRRLASEWFPDMRGAWRYKKDHNLAEAALIARFGERFVKDGTVLV